MTKIVKSYNEWKKIREKLKNSKQSIGFVPTMGALHEGHLSLIKRSKKECEITVVSIFVNPAQFNEKSDLENYPKTFDSDYVDLENLGVDFLFYPGFEEIYADNYRYKISEGELSKELCGEHRPGHFEGVLTVVMKLLNIVQPGKAYFGEKDYQQYLLIDGMVKSFFMDVEIIPCPVVRNSDGLALSSRNKRFNEDELKKASNFPKILKSNNHLENIKRELEEKGFKVDYVTEKFNRRFGAVHLGNVRLIDNVEI